MTDNRPAPGAINHIARTTLLLTGLLLAGCSANPATGPGGSRLRVFATDLTGGAKTCVAPKIVPVEGKTTESAIGMTNDGGWCGLLVGQGGAKPFDAGLLTGRPNHGTVTIHTVGDDTRVDYTPDRGFTGNDSFSVKLIPGSGIVHVTVAVTSMVATTTAKP